MTTCLPASQPHLQTARVCTCVRVYVRGETPKLLRSGDGHTLCPVSLLYRSRIKYFIYLYFSLFHPHPVLSAAIGSVHP